jgi:hypothetical protein
MVTTLCRDCSALTTAVADGGRCGRLEGSAEAYSLPL